MPDDPKRPVLVLLRHRNLDQDLPSDLAADLSLETADVRRTGTLGFTALLSDAQRATAAEHPLVAGLEDNPECLAPLRNPEHPDAPNRYIICTLRGVGTPADIVAEADLYDAEIKITGMWLTATLTPDQVNAVRRMPAVDYIGLTVTGRLF